MIIATEQERYVIVDRDLVKVGRVSWRILRALQSQRGQWVDSSSLISRVYDSESEPDWAHNSIRKLVSELRKRFGRDVIEGWTGPAGGIRLP